MRDGSTPPGRVGQILARLPCRTDRSSSRAPPTRPASTSGNAPISVALSRDQHCAGACGAHGRWLNGHLYTVRVMSAAEQFHVDEVSPSYWRVTFDNGPVNLLDPDTIDQLGVLIGRIENDPDLAVVVFRSDKPGYFMAHWDFLADNARVAAMPPGPTGLHPYVDNIVRLGRLPVATISEIRAAPAARAASSCSPLTSALRRRKRSWASSK